MCCPNESAAYLTFSTEEGIKVQIQPQHFWVKIHIFVESVTVIDLLFGFFCFSSSDTINYYCQVAKEFQLLFFSVN